MKTLVFNTGTDVVTFKVEGTKVVINTTATPQEFVANADTFEEQSNNERNLKLLRRTKGEKFYNQWKEDLKKFSEFKTEEEVIDDIMTDFHKKRGWRLVNE